MKDRLFLKNVRGVHFAKRSNPNKCVDLRRGDAMLDRFKRKKRTSWKL